MYELPAIEWSTKSRSGSGLWLAEVVATAGLLLVVFGTVRSGRANVAPFAVGAYIAAAYWFTASTSFANPAVTIARTLSNTFTGIRPNAVPAFIAFHLVGGGSPGGILTICKGAERGAQPCDASESLTRDRGARSRHDSVTSSVASWMSTASSRTSTIEWPS